MHNFFSDLFFLRSAGCSLSFSRLEGRMVVEWRVLRYCSFSHLIFFLILYLFLLSSLCFVFFVSLLSLSSFLKTTTQGFWFYHFHKQPQAKVVVTNLLCYYINNNNRKNLKVVVTRAEGDFQLGDQLRLIWTDQVVHLYMSKRREKS